MGFHFSNMYKPQALIFSNSLCELYIHLIFVEALQMEKNSHFAEFEVLSYGCGFHWTGSNVTCLILGTDRPRISKGLLGKVPFEAISQFTWVYFQVRPYLGAVLV